MARPPRAVAVAVAQLGPPSQGRRLAAAQEALARQAPTRAPLAELVALFLNGDLMPVQNYALIEDGIVVNTIVWDGNTENWQPPAGQTAVVIPPLPPGISIGWSYIDSTFLPPS